MLFDSNFMQFSNNNDYTWTYTISDPVIFTGNGYQSWTVPNNVVGFYTVEGIGSGCWAGTGSYGGGGDVTGTSLSGDGGQGIIVITY